MSSVTVYYAEESNLLSAELSNLLIYMKKNMLQNSSIYQCPAFVDVVCNTFYINSLIDFEIIWKKSNLTYEYSLNNKNNELELLTEPKEALRSFFQIKELMSGMYSLMVPRFIFFCESPMLIETQMPYIHTSDILKKNIIVPGRFDISKHFRFIEIPYMIKAFENCKVKEGDVLAYIKFITNKKVKLIRFKFDNKILYNYTDMLLRDFRAAKPLEWWYDLMFKFKTRENLIKYIKNNLLQ